MKIVKQIDDETFVISLKDVQTLRYEPKRLIVAHDYFRIISRTGLWTDSNEVKESLTGRHSMCSNVLNIPTDVTIGIKTAQKVLLPYLLKHEYMQPIHLADRTHTEDDKEWDKPYQKGKYTEPRYKKGDKYPCYSFNNEITEYWKDGQLMVEFSLEGEKAFSKVTKKFFDKFVKPELIKPK